jgi:hypothetical protein
VVPPLKSRARFAACAAAAFVLATNAFASQAPWPPPPAGGGAPPGPLVEVRLEGEHPSYIGFLTSFHDGAVTVELPGGEVRQELARDISALRFNPDRPAATQSLPPPPPPHSAEQNPPPRPPDRPVDRPADRPTERPIDRLIDRPNRLRDSGFRRLRALQDAEQRGELNDDDAGELAKLRADGPLFPDDARDWWRLDTARSAAQRASRTGKLDEHIAAMRERLSGARTLQDAHDAVLMLVPAYLHRDGPNLAGVRKTIVADIENVRDPELREALKKQPFDLQDIFQEVRKRMDKDRP